MDDDEEETLVDRAAGDVVDDDEEELSVVGITAKESSINIAQKVSLS
jgi:hypothetical protein